MRRAVPRIAFFLYCSCHRGPAERSRHWMGSSRADRHPFPGGSLRTQCHQYLFYRELRAVPWRCCKHLPAATSSLAARPMVRRLRGARPSALVPAQGRGVAVMTLWPAGLLDALTGSRYARRTVSAEASRMGPKGSAGKPNAEVWRGRRVADPTRRFYGRPGALDALRQSTRPCRSSGRGGYGHLEGARVIRGTACGPPLRSVPGSRVPGRPSLAVSA